MNDLPSGWTEASLADIASWGSGGTPSRNNGAYFIGDIPWVKTGELGPRILLKTEEHISELALKESSAKLHPKGSVILAMYGATIGKVSILGCAAATNQACAVGVPNDRVVTTEYLYHFLRSQEDAFRTAGQGGAQPNISQGVVKQWRIPLAPGEEQQRIADKLDTVLARVDACRDRLARVAPLLKRFRQSVLNVAMSGQLTDEWRGARSDETWQCLRILDFCVSVADGDHQAPPQAESGVPFITISAINNGRLDLTKASRFVPKSYFEILADKRRPKKGDVLYSVTGSIGIPALVDTEVDFSFQRHIAILRPDKNRISSAFLVLLLGSDQVKQQAISVATGTAQLTIPLGGLREISIELPPIEEQTEIVRRVETLFAFADRLETRLAKAQTAADRLTPALLAKAFRGELVPQDPNDEPASELLRRLQADAPPSKARRGKKSSS